MSRTKLKIVRRRCRMEVSRKPLDAYAWPGGYPMFYVTKDCGVLCPDCANKEIDLCNDPHDPQWYIIGADVNYEDTGLYCDNCNKLIEAAYAD